MISLSDNPLDQDLHEQARLVREGQVSPVDLVEAAIARAEELSPTVNAVITRNYEEARAEAASPSVEGGPFAGVPYLAKDSGLAVGGMRATLASDWFGETVHAADDQLAHRLRLSGLIFLGATNVPEMLVSASTESRRFGPTRNPWRLDLSSGGSSGGAAAAVATGIVAAAHASDGSGSIRIPASCCGVFGFKPSGSGSLAGSVAQRARRQGVQHAITRSVRDSAALLDVAAGHVTIGHEAPVPLPERSYAEQAADEPTRLRVALSTASPLGTDVDPACVAAARAAAELLAELGHEVVEDQPAIPPETFDAVSTIENLTIVGLLSRLEANRDPVDPGAELPGVLTFMRECGEAVTPAERAEALRALESGIAAAASLWERCDVWLTPTLGEPPLALGELDVDAADPSTFFARDARFNPFTPIANWMSLPAASLPLAMADGVPIGVQLAAAPQADGSLLALCAQLERARPWSARRPPTPALPSAAVSRSPSQLPQEA